MRENKVKKKLAQGGTATRGLHVRHGDARERAHRRGRRCATGPRRIGCAVSR